jgi:Icc protein
VRVLQLTDIHLFADPEGELLGQNTRSTFELVLDLVRKTFWPVDRILLTGDLVHDETPAGYRYLEQRMEALATPCHCLPGNHDSSRLMADVLPRGPLTIPISTHCGAWNLVFLDSTIPGEDGGHLGTAQLEALESALGESPDRHALVCLHHQPVPVGSAWMDTMALDNPEAFFRVIDQHPQVRGVLWGHVHQEFTGWRRQILLLGSPSTCIQFLPGSETFAMDRLTPGFRWLDLHSDGRISTGVQRIAAYPQPVDLSNTGGY